MQRRRLPLLRPPRFPFPPCLWQPCLTGLMGRPEPTRPKTPWCRPRLRLRFRATRPPNRPNHPNLFGRDHLSGAKCLPDLEWQYLHLFLWAIVRPHTRKVIVFLKWQSGLLACYPKTPWHDPTNLYRPPPTSQSVSRFSLSRFPLIPPLIPPPPYNRARANPQRCRR